MAGFKMQGQCDIFFEIHRNLFSSFYQLASRFPHLDIALLIIIAVKMKAEY